MRDELQGMPRSERIDAITSRTHLMATASTPVTLPQLESHLWESAMFSGPVDAAAFKTYIFPLFFVKRVCDVWDEEARSRVRDADSVGVREFL
jgi:type I restriction-modification system DNA methylase subunit